MDTQKVIQQWVKTAEKDWQACQHLYEAKDYCQCLFWGHLVLEKMLKALVVKNTQKQAPLSMAKGIFSEPAVKKMVRSYKEKLETHKIHIQKMYLYGSYAKKNPHSESDIDLCIVSPEFTDRIEATMMLMKLRSDEELFLSPIAFSPETFLDENPLAWEVKQTGIEIN